MSIEFPYQYKIIAEGKIPEPIIQLPVKTKAGFGFIDFLVDSGADTTTLPLIWSEIFGFKIENKKPDWITGVEGGRIAAYPGEIEIKIGREKNKIRCLFVTSNILPLLGRLDIWNKFSIIFDNKRQKIIFEKV